MSTDDERRFGARGALACAAFAVFFGVAAVLALGARLWPRPRERAARRRFTTRLDRGFRLLLGLLEVRVGARPDAFVRETHGEAVTGPARGAA
ncbi:MAG: hypothetical protein KF729_22710 [Sandaracinaceae bacterium]|nr:hypothetical protein [Sandaracinaceae bacterium]